MPYKLVVPFDIGIVGSCSHEPGLVNVTDLTQDTRFQPEIDNFVIESGLPFI